MVNILTPKQRSALNRALKHPELLPRLYKNINGLIWFDAFTQSGLLNPECNPKPKHTKDNDFFQIPFWPITEYLVNTSHLLKNHENIEYALKYRNLLRNVTKYSIRNKYGNYRTWWQFAKIIKNIPIELLEDQDIELVRHWVTDKFERKIIGETIGEWLLDLFEINNMKAKNISFQLLNSLYEVSFIEEENEKNKSKAILLFNSYKLENLTNKIAQKASISLGVPAVDLFKHQLERILDSQKNDKFSSIWRPAIEEHNQNMRKDDAGSILLKAFREALIGLFTHNNNAAENYISELFNSKYQTIIRVAIFVTNQMHSSLPQDVSSKAIDKSYFKNNYRHELWNLLSDRFALFPDNIKIDTLNIIDNLTVIDDGEDLSEKRDAYLKTTWLSAIYDKDIRANSLYKKYINVTKTIPEHPNFSSYTSVGWVDHKSPIELEILKSLEHENLVRTLNDYIGGNGFRDPGIEGLTRAFKELVKLDAVKLYKDLDKFIILHVPYIYSLIDAFLDLWDKRKSIQLPWNNIWPNILDYIHKVILQDKFWSWPESRKDGAFVANHHWVVSTIGRLIEAGCKSDDQSFDVKNIELSKSILCLLLEKESGEEYKLNSDAVFISINSPRGRCLEAIISLSLFTCRNHSKIDLTHSEAWTLYLKIFNLELEKPKYGEYEFATLVCNHINNFLYLSEEWTITNLPNIFDQTNHQRWICAMQGYSYVNNFDHRIYRYLRDNGDLIKVLDDNNLSDRTNDRYLQLITYAYLKDIEDLNDSNSLISILLKRAKHNELNQVIWFLWTFRKNIDDQLKSKAYQLWPILLSIVDNTKQGKTLASNLSHLSIFIDEIDIERKTWLMAIAPYAEFNHNSYDLLKTLSRLSNKYAFDIKDIWIAMLSEYSYDYPEEEIKIALGNLVKKGKPGIQAAKEIVGAYLKHGIDRPVEWLNEILNSELNSKNT